MSAAELMERTSLPAHDQQFDNFLFATVGEDRNGMQVSVLSALARLGVEPWQEAKQLARLSEELACARVDGLIAELPGVPSLIHDHRVIAERIIALLPRLTRFGLPRSPPTAADDAATASRNLVTALFVIFLLVSQAIFLARAPSTQVDGTGTGISGETTAIK